MSCGCVVETDINILDLIWILWNLDFPDLNINHASRKMYVDCFNLWEEVWCFQKGHFLLLGSSKEEFVNRNGVWEARAFFVT